VAAEMIAARRNSTASLPHLSWTKREAETQK
jgi:hypothetical protein